MNRSEREKRQWVVLESEALQNYVSLIELGDRCLATRNFDIAENFYKAAIDYAVDTWGPYHFMEASALLSLSTVYACCGREEEADVAYILSRKILEKF